LSSEGLCAYDGVKAAPFQPQVLKDFLPRINKEIITQAVGTVYGQKVLFALPLDNADENNAVLEYDTVRDAFSLKKGFCAESFVVIDDVLQFSDGTTYIKFYNNGDTYDGVPIQAFWETPFTDAGDRASMKYLDTLYAFGKGDAMAVSVISEKETKQKTVTLDEDTETHIKMKLQGKGVRFKLRFANVSGGYFQLTAPEIHFERDA